MGNIRLAVSLLKQHKLLDFIYILEVAFVIMALSLMYNFIQVIRLDLDSIDNFPYKAVFYSSMNHQYEKFDFRETKEKIENMPGFLAWSSTQHGIFPDYYTIIYDKYSKELFKENLPDGVWFTEYTGDKKYIPCVVTNATGDIKTGDKLELDGKDFIVTGLADPDMFFFWLEGSSGTEPDCPLRGFKETGLNTNKPIIIYGAENDAEESGTVEEDARKFVYFDKNTSDEQYNKNIAEMRKFGGVETLEEIRELSYKSFWDEVSEYIPYIAVFVAFVLLGVLSMSVLNGRIIGKRFSVYYLCGCPWNKGSAIYALYVFFLSAASLVVYLLMVLFLQNQRVLDMSVYGCVFCAEDIKVVITVTVTCSVIAYIPVALIRRTLSPISAIKNL